MSSSQQPYFEVVRSLDQFLAEEPSVQLHAYMVLSTDSQKTGDSNTTSPPSSRRYTADLKFTLQSGSSFKGPIFDGWACFERLEHWGNPWTLMVLRVCPLSRLMFVDCSGGECPPEIAGRVTKACREILFELGIQFESGLIDETRPIKP